MATFTPDTYEVRFPADEVAERYGVVGLTRRLVGVQRPYWVYIINGVANPAPGTGPSQDSDAQADAGSGHYGKAIFEGGRTYTITAQEETILEAAGYDIDGDES